MIKLIRVYIQERNVFHCNWAFLIKHIFAYVKSLHNTDTALELCENTIICGNKQNTYDTINIKNTKEQSIRFNLQ